MSALSWLRISGLAALAAAAICIGACGDETGSSGTETSSSTSGSTSSGGGMGGGSGGTGGAGGTSGQGGSGGGSAAACDMLKPGPFEPTLVYEVFDGSEDFAFNGKGQIAAKNKTNVILVDSMGISTQLAANVPTTYGIRYRPDGYLVAALPNDSKIVEISPQGTVADYATGLIGANGVYPDFDGNVWFTEIGAGKVSRINPDKSVDIIVQGPNAAGANGVVYDANRKILFYTNFGQGRIRSVDMSGSNPAMPVEVITIANSKLDGLVMDACGHLYVVDQSNSRLYRIQLDAAGAPTGAEELLAEFPKNIANAQFGSGMGFDPMKLYATGNPGALYSIDIGVPGAPVPIPQ